jgi:hypothetical protein
MVNEGGPALGAAFVLEHGAGENVISAARQTRRQTMPVFLLVGIPVVLLGGGYFIIHAMH